MARAKTPITLVTGYLGSGKTTLVNRLLAEQGADPMASNEKVAILVNEFGAVGIDGALLADSASTAEGLVVELANGCICCVVTGEFQKSLAELATRASFDRVVIETSGAADPTSVIKTLWGAPELTDAYRLDGVICVVDAERVLETLKADPVAALQIAVADRAVISKAERAGEAAVEAARVAIAAINPELEPILALAAKPLRAGLFKIDGYRKPGRLPFRRDGQSLHGELVSVAVSWDGRVPRARLQEFFQKLVLGAAQGGFGETVVRTKALLHVEGEEGCWLVQGVQTWIERGKAPKSYQGPNRLVVLGRALDVPRLNEAIARLRGGDARA